MLSPRLPPGSIEKIISATNKDQPGVRLSPSGAVLLVTPMVAITPSLFAGQPEDAVCLNDLIWAGAVGEAVKLIEDGRCALLAYENWQEQARDVLGLLGASQEHISWLIATAPRVNENLAARWPDTVPVNL
jgi:hypothetical protein